MIKRRFLAVLAVLLFFSMFSLIEIGHATVCILGYSTAGGDSQGPNGISGDAYVMPVKGYPINMSLNCYGNTAYNAKCAIYNSSGAYIASTLQVSIPHISTYTWYNFTFDAANASVPLYAGVSYYLVYVANGSDYIKGTNSGSTDYANTSYPYPGSFPSSLTFSTAGNFHVSLYLNYNTTAPQYANMSASTVYVNSSCTFQASMTSDGGTLSSYIFSTNNTGPWVNDSAVAISGSSYVANTTKTLNSTAGKIVGFCWYTNDSSNSWTCSGNQTITLLTSVVSAVGVAATINALNLASNINWAGASVDTLYAGYSLGYSTLAQVEAAVDALPNSQNITILYWAQELSKYGYSNVTTIERALDSVIMMTCGLPQTGASGALGQGPLSFCVSNRYVLWGFNFSQFYNYETAKWNLATAYESFKNAVDGWGAPILWVYYNGTGIPSTSRYYDEAAQTIDCYLIFYQMGISGALVQAENWWSWVNTNLWDSTYSFYHYSLYTSWLECEAGGFYQIAYELYCFDQNVPYMSRVTTDAYTRFLGALWNSYQWQDFVCVHAKALDGSFPNNESRLQNTLMAWSSLEGLYPLMNSTEQIDVQNLLNGTAAGTPAYALLNNSQAGLYVSASNKYGYSNKGSVSDSATVYAANLLSFLALVPVNASLAVPLQQFTYEDMNNIVNQPLYNFNYTSRTVTLSLESTGTIQFLYGTSPVNYAFPATGVWQVTFASNWNSITSVLNTGSLPSLGAFYPLALVAPGIPSNSSTSTLNPSNNPTQKPTVPNGTVATSSTTLFLGIPVSDMPTVEGGIIVGAVLLLMTDVQHNKKRKSLRNSRKTWSHQNQAAKNKKVSWKHSKQRKTKWKKEKPWK